MKLHTQNIENGTVLNGLSISVFFMLYGGLFKGGCGYPGFESREQIDTNIQKPLHEKHLHSLQCAILFIQLCTVWNQIWPQSCFTAFAHTANSDVLNL